MPPINLYRCIFCYKRMFFSYYCPTTRIASLFRHHIECPRDPLGPWLELIHGDPVPYYLIEGTDGVLEDNQSLPKDNQS